MANVPITLEVDDKDALKAIDKFAKEATKNLKSIDFGINFLAVVEGFKLIGGAAKSAFKAVTGFASDLVSAASVQEDAINRLNTALSITGKFSNEASEDLQNFASALQATSKFGDEAILSSAGLIQNLARLDTEGLKQATQSAADLSAALGIDLESASSLVAKALNGQTGALARYGIQVKKGATDTETFANVITALNNQFGGSAAAQLNTFSGALAQAKNAYGDIFEEAGTVITQNRGVIIVLQEATKAFLKITEFIKENRQAISDLIRDGIIKLLNILPLIIDGFSILNFTMEATVKVTNSLKKAFNIIGGIIDATASRTKPLAKTISEVLSENKAIDDSTKAFEENSTQREVFLQKIKSQTEGFIDTVEKRILAENDATVNFKKNNKEQLDSLTEFTDEQKKLREKAFQDISKNPFEALNPESTKLLTEIEIGIAGGLGGVQEILKGAAGATNIIKNGIGTIANTLMPGIGAAVGEIVGVLAQGPEAVRQLITDFLTSIPTIIENIILALPEAIIALVENLDIFLERLIEKIPVIIDRLIQKLPELFAAIQVQLPSIATQFAISLAAQAPFIAISITTEFIKNIPNIAIEIGKQAGEAIKNIIGSVGGLFGGGDGGGGIGGFLDKLNPFARGGLVPPGFNNDTLPARLSSGEVVFDTSTTDRLLRFLDEFESEGAAPNAPQAQQQSLPQTISVVLNVAEEQLASVLLNLQRQGFRTA